MDKFKLILLILFVCNVIVGCKRRKFYFEVKDQKNINITVRLYFEHSILSFVKNLRRKWSERRNLNRMQKMQHGNRKQCELKILSWNSGHSYLTNQINEVKWLIQEKTPHILFVSESILRQSHDKSLVEIDGYSLHTTSMIENPERQVSRLVAFVKDGIVVKRRRDLEKEDFSSIWMEAGLPKQRKFLICGVYREWAHLKTDGGPNDDSGSASEQERRWNQFLDSWEDALDETEDVSVIGDVNIDLSKVFVRGNHYCKKMAEELQLRILSRGVLQVVKDYTRFRVNVEPSLLDHIYMTRPELGRHQVSEWGSSDHRLIELFKKVKGPLPNAMRMRKRTFKNFSKNNFLKDVKEIKWYGSVFSKNDVDDAVEGWHREFSKVLDMHCPVRSIEIRKNYTPWLSQDLIVSSKALQRAQRLAKCNLSQELQEDVEKKIKLLKKKIKAAEDKWREKEAAKMSESGAKTWKNVKQWVGWRSTNQPVILKDPSQNNCVSIGASNLCRIMNDFYLEKVRSIKSNMVDVEGDPCTELMQMLSETDEFLTIGPISPEVVLKTGKKMKKSKSMGRDDIPADLFILALPFMLPAITHIYNLSLTQAKFPSMWKVSKICPLFKGGEQSGREDPKQYRPVALLPVAARLLEKIVCDQIMKYLYEKKLLHSQNHGYRKFHGTITALLEAQEAILDAVDNGEFVGIVTLDQSAAFDVIEHQILNSKLRLYGFDGHSLGWFSSYLQDRSQYVALETSKSEERLIGPFACPQGSCLGPLIWNLYCGEAPEILPLRKRADGDQSLIIGGRKEVENRWKAGNLTQYADDFMVIVKGKTLDIIRSKASEAYNILQNWFLRNRLKLNSKKTDFMFVMTRQRAAGKQLEDPVSFGSDMVAPSAYGKVLGITLESHLSMNAHLISGDSSIFNQVTRKMRALWIIKRHLSFKSRKMTAWGLVMSKILYGIEVWGPSSSETLINKMQVLQNSIMRWICDARRGTRTNELLDMTGMLSIRQLIIYRVLMLGLTAGWHGTPGGICKWHKEKPRKLLTTTRSFRYVLGKILPKLPVNIRNGNPRKNKKLIKNWVVDNIPRCEKWQGLDGVSASEESDDGGVVYQES